MSGLTGWARAICGIPRYWKRSHDTQYVRLAIMRETTPRFTPGSYDFPFGRVDYADSASFEAQYFSIFTKEEYAFETDSATPVILDCGGNIGLSSLWFKQRYPAANITVFEPGPDLFSILKTNLDRFGFDDIHAEQTAVWNEDTTLYLGNDAADGGFVSEGERQGSRAIKAIRLAERINGPVDLLKLDIEGAEYDVMRDLAQTGKLNHIRAIAGELHAGSDDTGNVGELLSTLHDHGFKTTLSYARPAPALFCRTEATPFPCLRDGKYLAIFYAWKA